MTVTGVIFIALVLQTCPKKMTSPFITTISSGLDSKKHLQRSAIYPLFLVIRRALYVYFLMKHDSNPSHQIIMLLALSLLMMLIMVKTRPFENKRNLALQIFNELNVFLITALLFGFTEVNYRYNDAEMGKITTYCIMASLALIVVVNTVFIVHSCIFDGLHTYRVYKKELRQKKLEKQRSSLVETQVIEKKQDVCEQSGSIEEDEKKD